MYSESTALLMRRYELEDKVRTDEEDKEYFSIMKKLEEINPEMAAPRYIRYCF